MKKIGINFIPQSRHRYDTWGDWYYDELGNLVINVSDDNPELDTENKKFLIALHELIEVWLCRNNGITQYEIDKFDIDYFPSLNVDMEPGDHPDAPYKKEHRFAMLIEHLMARELGINEYGTVK